MEVSKVSINQSSIPCTLELIAHSLKLITPLVKQTKFELVPLVYEINQWICYQVMIKDWKEIETYSNSKW